MHPDLALLVVLQTHDLEAKHLRDQMAIATKQLAAADTKAKATVGQRAVIAGLISKEDALRRKEESEIADLRVKLERNKKTGKFSKGQRTAVALILAFSIRPRIFVLDEPASGLDPIFQRLVLDLMIEAAAGGATILFSSHQIGQVERAADRVAILKNGKLVVDGSVDELKTTEKIVEAIFASAAPDIDGLASDPRVRRIERSGRIVRAYVRDGSDAIAKRFEEFSPRDVSIMDLGLEDIFLTAVDGRDATIPHGDQA